MNTALNPGLRDAAMRWIADDPDPDTRVELQRVLAAALTGDRALPTTSPIGWPQRCGSAPRGCAGRSAPARTA